MTCPHRGERVAVALTAGATSLSKAETEALVDDLIAEGEGLPNPTPIEYSDWRSRQEKLLSLSELPAARKDSIRQDLDRLDLEPMPDGATFHAWRNLEARARYQDVVDRAVAYDLDEPNPADYDLGEDGRPTHVWYATYGSNLDPKRLETYIKGGTPTGSNRTYTGCDDKTLPAEDAPIRIQGWRPHFAMNSRVWGGGIAFLGEESPETTSLGRAYLIPIRQYDQIIAQENGGTGKDAPSVDVNAAITNGTHDDTGGGAYNRLVHLGDLHGAPVLTFTGNFSHSDALTNSALVPATADRPMTSVKVNKPSAAYAHVIARGLTDTYGLSEVDAADYLRGCGGGTTWGRQNLVKTLREPPPAARPAASTREWTTRRATGEAYPPVATYRSREEQRAGIRMWRRALDTAAFQVTAAQSKADDLRDNDTPTYKKVVGTRLAEALRAAKEAETKVAKAEAQKPKDHYNPNKRTRAQWRSFADDLGRDLDAALDRANNANPGTRKHDKIMDRVATLTEQREEARRHANPPRYDDINEGRFQYGGRA